MNKSLYPSFKVLLVDDEVSFLRSLSITLERSGGVNNILKCSDSREVISILKQEDVGLVLLDLTMPHFSGEQLLEKIAEHHPEIGVIIISGMNQIETAVDCMRLGAYDYFVKTTEEDRLIRGVQRAIQTFLLKREHLALRSRLLDDCLDHPEVFEKIITVDKGVRSVFQYLESVATSGQPILITGESGVGKELIAQAAHKLSNVPGLMISLNVSGLDDNVFADTLFGHKAGAYTGARDSRSGMVEQAANGTLFLDEIGDLSIASQVKLLRLLQSNEYYPLGSDHLKRAQARIIAATHQDLDKNQMAGKFRNDLFYRLRTHHVHIPPLRKRKGDILLLLHHFLTEAAMIMNKKVPTIPKELEVLLKNYTFPGNVRELKAMVYDAVSAHKSRMLSMDTFKRAMGDLVHKVEAETVDNDFDSVFATHAPLPSIHDIPDLLVQEAMKRASGNQSIAAKLIGVSQPALSKRLAKSRIRDDEGFGCCKPL